MRAVLALLIIATLAASGTLARADALGEACELYLAVRERLAPREVCSHGALSSALGTPTRARSSCWETSPGWRAWRRTQRARPRA